MAVELQELKDLFHSHSWPTKQTSLRWITNRSKANGKKSKPPSNLPSLLYNFGGLQLGFLQLHSRRQSFLLKEKPRMEVAKREFTVATAVQQWPPKI